MALENWKIGYEPVHDEISILLSSFPPPFIYVTDVTSPRITTSFFRSLLQNISYADPGPSKIFSWAIVDAVACFTPRLLYDTILNSLAQWQVDWDNGCANWALEGGNSQRFNESFDGFIHGLQAVFAYLNDGAKIKGKEKGKGAAKEKGKQKKKETDGVRLVIVIESAHRLKETLPELLVPLTRLAELARLDLTIIFISEVRWEDIRPPFGASPDPYFVDIVPPSKETIVQRIVSKFVESKDDVAGPFHPSLRGLYQHFITVLCDVCYPYTHDSQEIEYIAAARWPGFVQPVLDDHLRTLEARKNDMDTDDDDSLPPLLPPSEEVRMRLTRLFNPSLSKALEELYPRLTNATDWAQKHKPEPDLLRKHPQDIETAVEKSVKYSENGIQVLPRMSKFILVAAFLASTNPAKSDLKMFGRGLDEKKRHRRQRRITKKGPTKIPQRLLGPLPFPLDRLLAILGALLEENDVESRPPAPEYTIPGEYTDMEISRANVYSVIVDLTFMRLLHRTTPPDRIDGPPQFKCGISYDVTLALARQLSIPFNDLMWDLA